MDLIEGLIMFVALRLPLIIAISILTCSVAHAEIRQTDNLQVIAKEIFASPKDTLVIFDIDQVLITPSDEIFVLSDTDEAKKFLTETYNDLFARLSKPDVDDLQSTLMLNKPWRLVTPDTAKVFNEIKNKGYKVLGLTASGSGAFGKIRSMEEWRVSELNKVGINFDEKFINAKSGSLDQYIPEVSKYYAKHKHVCFPAASNGIIFTCLIPKGEVLDAYLQFANIKPSKIIFIDDRLSNLEAVSEYCKKHNVQYLGYEYTAVKEQAKNLKLNKRRAKFQYKILELTKVWLNDAQADMVLHDIDRN